MSYNSLGLRLDEIEMQSAVLVVVFAILTHLLLIYFPTVNLEFAFIDAAEYFRSSMSSQLEQYFAYQANTLGMPYLIHLISVVFPDVGFLVLFRVVNLIGLVFLAIGVCRICSYLDIKNHAIILLLLVLNPLVWAFSERATADFLPAALGVFAISLALGERNIVIKALMSGVLLGLSVVFKYHALCLLLFLAALLVLKDRHTSIIIKLAIVSTVSFVMLGCYLMVVHSIFGFWVTPTKYQVVHHISLSNLINNLILYTGFLGLLAMPTFFLSKDFYQSIKRKLISVIFLAVLTILGYYMLQDGGELNFGPVDSLLSDRVRVFILALMCLATSTLIFSSDIKSNKVKFTLGLALLMTLFVFSSSRPAQRYLLFVLPFFILGLPVTILNSKTVVFTTLGIFISANFFIESSRWATGMAANLMVKKLEVENLIQKTDAGAIEGHVGNKFYRTKDISKTYIVIAGKNNQSIITTTAGIPFFEKSFSLISLNK